MGTLKPLENIRVLLLDDDFLTLEAYQVFLTMEGAEVKSANSVGSALALLEEWIPHVIVSDIGLPGEDGYSFIGKIRSNPRLSGVHTIAITGYSNSVARIEAAGFDLVLKKPLIPDDLLAEIQSLNIKL